MALVTRYAESDEDRARFAKTLSWSFGSNEETSRSWLVRPGMDHVRLGFSDRELVAGLAEIRMGQWFGGRRVPTLGIAGVAVRPEARGQGHARTLMRDTLVTARSDGFALSTLYPSALALYRRAGYELSGSYCRYEVPLARLPITEGALHLSGIEEQHRASVEATYQKAAQRRTGYLDRGTYVWDRVTSPMGKPARGVMANGAEGLEGYAYLRQRPHGDGSHDLVLSDFVARTPRATLSLLTYLARHRSVARNALWFGGVAESALLQLTGGLEVNVAEYWMLRIVDVKSALLARGYPALHARVALRVEDELLPDNTGTYQLSVDDGSMAIEHSTGEGDAALDVRALAPLYTGFQNASSLAELGLLRGTGEAVRTLDALFAGPAPGLADYF
jgi:predicted acetyltransferase